VGSVTHRPLFNPGKGLVLVVEEAGWAPGPVLTGAENLVPTAIRSRTVQPVASRYSDYTTRPKIEGRKPYNLPRPGARIYCIYSCLYGRDKGTVHPVTGHEIPEVE